MLSCIDKEIAHKPPESLDEATKNPAVPKPPAISRRDISALEKKTEKRNSFYTSRLCNAEAFGLRQPARLHYGYIQLYIIYLDGTQWCQDPQGLLQPSDS